MKRGTIVFGLIAIAALLWAGLVFAGPTAVGAEKCKMCHKLQFDSWSVSKHAASNPKVECETCHGPGSDYKVMSIMKDPEKAKAAGLVAKPGKAMCTEKCHKDKWSDDQLTKVHAHKQK